MIDLKSKLLLFVKDFAGQGADDFFWLDGDKLTKITAHDVVSSPVTVVCHDFWMVRDVLFDKTGDLPRSIVDLDEFRISISGNPEDRLARERFDITAQLERYGASADTCSTYKRMFNKGVDFDQNVARDAAKAMANMYVSLCAEASSNGELERFFSIEIPVYRLLQRAMSVGININAKGLSQKRREAEFDYYFCLKNYSAKHDMPLETPTMTAIEERLGTLFDLNGVSTEYVLEFVPHGDGFGHDTIALQNFDVAKRILSSLTLSSGQTRPVIDVFGSRTSRIHLRSPSLQNMPKKYRSIVVAREGAHLCYVDFDQYEVGIMAALSGDPELATLYGAGDMYDLFATSHLGLEGKRKEAKQLFLSYAYGMTRKALIDAAVALGADRARAKSAFNVFATYEEWKKTVWGNFQREGSVATVLGNHYKRSAGGDLSAKERRSAISQVVQGTASLIFKKAILEVGSLEDVTIVLPMHDALLFEHHLKETPAKVVAAFKRVMTEGLQGRISGKASVGHFASN